MKSRRVFIAAVGALLALPTAIALADSCAAIDQGNTGFIGSVREVRYLLGEPDGVMAGPTVTTLVRLDVERVLHGRVGDSELVSEFGGRRPDGSYVFTGSYRGWQPGQRFEVHGRKNETGIIQVGPCSATRLLGVTEQSEAKTPWTLWIILSGGIIALAGLRLRLRKRRPAHTAAHRFDGAGAPPT